jgi:hypothetical protein
VTAQPIASQGDAANAEQNILNTTINFQDVFIEHGAVVDISDFIGEKIGLDRKKYELFQ